MGDVVADRVLQSFKPTNSLPNDV